MAAPQGIPAPRERRLYWAWRGLRGGSEAGSSVGTFVGGLGVPLGVLIQAALTPQGGSWELLLSGCLLCGIFFYATFGAIQGGIAGGLGGFIGGLTKRRWLGQWLGGLAGGGIAVGLFLPLTRWLFDDWPPPWLCFVAPMGLASLLGGFWGGRRGLMVARGETSTLVRRFLPAAFHGGPPPGTSITRPPIPPPSAPTAPTTAITARDQIAEGHPQ
jgi:hypothetical protein